MQDYVLVVFELGKRYSETLFSEVYVINLAVVENRMGFLVAFELGKKDRTKNSPMYSICLAVVDDGTI